MKIKMTKNYISCSRSFEQETMLYEFKKEYSMKKERMTAYELNFIQELEVRLNYTDAQIEQTQKELRKTQDELKTLEGQKIAYMGLLDHIKVEQQKNAIQGR